MSKTVAAFLILALFVIVGLASADDFKGLTDVEVYFNDQVATVDNATLKVGEPFTVKAVIKAKKVLDIGVKLTASGFKDDEPQPYEVISGPSQFAKSTGVDNITQGNETTFEWKLKPTSVWAGGTTPLDISFSFYDISRAKGYPLSFTVANIYISKETYTGSAAAPSQPEMSVFSIVKTPVVQTPATSVPQKQTGFEVALALAALLSLAYVLRGKKRRTK